MTCRFHTSFDLNDLGFIAFGDYIFSIELSYLYLRSNILIIHAYLSFT